MITQIKQDYNNIGVQVRRRGAYCSAMSLKLVITSSEFNPYWVAYYACSSVLGCSSWETANENKVT